MIQFLKYNTSVNSKNFLNEKDQGNFIRQLYYEI